MKKTKHNKKRNTAVLYEVLATELTKNVVEGNANGKKTVLKILKEFFRKGTLLSQELDLYRALRESTGMSDDLAKRLLNKVIDTYDELDSESIFKEQNELLKKMNQELPKAVFTNFIPDYKNLASISQIFSKNTPVRDKVLLEQKMLEQMSSDPEKIEENKLKVIDNLTYKTFVKKFNTVYGESLLPEQKELMTRFVMSFSDNSVELKTFLNTELPRLREKIQESLELEEIKSDPSMMEKTKLVLEKMVNYRNKPVNKELVSEVLKIQSLVKEIQS